MTLKKVNCLLFFLMKMSTTKYNIILNVDHVKDGINDVPLYKMHGSYYRSKILDSRDEKIFIHPNVLYVINCYDIAKLLKIKKL